MATGRIMSLGGIRRQWHNCPKSCGHCQNENSHVSKNRRHGGQAHAVHSARLLRKRHYHRDNCPAYFLDSPAPKIQNRLSSLRYFVLTHPHYVRPHMSLTQLGRFIITGTLGRGAMGVVYKAYDPLIERVVAIKTVSHRSLTPIEAEDFEQRFSREAKSAVRLNRPNIVTIHDVGSSDD